MKTNENKLYFKLQKTFSVRNPYSTSHGVLHMEGVWQSGGGGRGVVGRVVPNLRGFFGGGGWEMMYFIINTLDLETSLG